MSGHPNLNGAQTCGAHPLAIVFHALRRRNWPSGRTRHVRLHFVTCYTKWAAEVTRPVFATL